jgi:hypothetical protein
MTFLVFSVFPAPDSPLKEILTSLTSAVLKEAEHMCIPKLQLIQNKITSMKKKSRIKQEKKISSS